MKKVRCAIYTRKSSEEGLEQDFNSLHAQREACAAYVLSQASEGWSLLPQCYDDGGLSGGSLDRPALQQLLSDVAAGLVDIIVVYKVDRLTRSLLDFAKLVEALDKAGTSFVSVTQSFNTTTSMRRLTLNMLLSFAQFEREVTAERIRDKIAASKARGMWMGGTPPLGYEPNGRSLAIVEEHAAIVRDIYRRYLDLGNVRLVADQLDGEGKLTPIRTSQVGRAFGGCRFTRGQLYAILRNPIYVGKIVHRGKVHAGQHPPIIDSDIWARVQELLSEHVRGTRRQATINTSVLAGKIVDENGEPLVAVHACKGKVRYRYYVSRLLQHGGAGAKVGGIRLPAREIELLVAEQVANLFDDPISLAAYARMTMTPRFLEDIGNRCSAIATGLRGRSRLHLVALVKQVRVFDEKVEIDLFMEELAILLGTSASESIPPVSTFAVAVRPTRSGRAVRLVQPNGSGVGSAAPDQSLIKLLLKARAWWDTLAKGQVNISTLAREAGVTPAYMTRVVRMAFLAPVIVEAILEGKQRSDAHGTALTATGAIPTPWLSQVSRLLPND